MSKLNLFCFESSCDNLKGQWTFKTMFIVNCRCFTRVKCFFKKVKSPAMDKQKTNDMFCCQTSNTISESQKCSPQCSQNRGSKKSIRPHFPSKTGSLPLILRLRDGYQLCFFQLLLHLFQLLDCCPNFSTPTHRNDRCPFPRKKEETNYMHIIDIYTY